MSDKQATIFTADLRKDQWDLIVMALEHIRGMADSTASGYSVDAIGRKFLRRCIVETVGDIQSQVPK